MQENCGVSFGLHTRGVPLKCAELVNDGPDAWITLEWVDGTHITLYIEREPLVLREYATRFRALADSMEEAATWDLAREGAKQDAWSEEVAAMVDDDEG